MSCLWAGLISFSFCLVGITNYKIIGKFIFINSGLILTVALGTFGLMGSGGNDQNYTLGFRVCLFSVKCQAIGKLGVK